MEMNGTWFLVPEALKNDIWKNCFTLVLVSCCEQFSLELLFTEQMSLTDMSKHHQIKPQLAAWLDRGK